MLARVVAVLGLVLFVSASLDGRADADQVVAVAGSMTGDMAPNGVATANGVKRAVAAINAKGGLLGQKLVEVINDDACDADQAEAAARRLTELAPAVVIGHFCSSCSIRAAPIYAKGQILQISPSSTNPQLTEMGIGTLFRMIGRDDNQGKVAGDRIARQWPATPVALLNDGSVYGKGLVDILRARLKEHGIAPAIDEAFEPGAQSYAELVLKLKKAGVRATYIGGYELDIAVITRDVAAEDVRTTIMGGDVIQDISFWKAAGKAGENVEFTYPPEPIDQPAGRAMIEDAHRDGVEITADAVTAFAAVEVWSQAVAQVRSFDTAKVAAALHAGSFESRIGMVRFDGKGDIVGPQSEWLWYRWKDGKIEHADDRR